MSNGTSRSVAVIGAGAAGLISAKVLREAGHTVRVFERQAAAGGTWIYDPLTDAQRMKQSGRPVYSSVYASLRTNLPTALMGVPGFAFEPGVPSFPGHADVLRYLQRYEAQHGLANLVSYNTSVDSVQPIPHKDVDGAGSDAAMHCDGAALPRWRISTTHTMPSTPSTPSSTSSPPSPSAVADFDAVLVCSGHYAAPHVPDIPGAGEFQEAGGRLMHSHDYREPSAFRGRKVLLLGAAASAADLSREVATVADGVWLSHPSVTTVAHDAADRTEPGSVPITRCPGLYALSAGAAHVSVSTGCSSPGAGSEAGVDLRIEVDDVILCTGYRFEYPFLRDIAMPTGADDVERSSSSAGAAQPLLLRRVRLPVSGCEMDVNERLVAPLFEQVAHAVLPNLGFIGLPFRVVPFPLFEAQATWFARHLAGTARTPLPPLRERLHQHHERLAALESDVAGTDVGADAVGPRADSVSGIDNADAESTYTNNVKLHHYHLMGDVQWSYARRLLEESGAPLPDERLPALRAAADEAKKMDPLRYRQWHFELLPVEPVAGAAAVDGEKALGYRRVPPGIAAI